MFVAASIETIKIIDFNSKPRRYNVLRISIFLVLSLITVNLNAAVVTTVLGDVDEQNPLVLKLIESTTFNRLKHIDQSGPDAYFTQQFPKLSRYDHSLGVYALLKMYNVSVQEQIAGLMHDASHTAFSHLADIIFQNSAERTESYQDSIHDHFLKTAGVDKIIFPYNLTLADISPKNPKFTALEQSFPDMNADRIEYNLHTALVFKQLTNNDVQQILQSLHYENKKWYFDDIHKADKFARLSTFYTRTLWGSHHNVAIYTATSAAIQYAIQHKIVTKEEIHFGTDQQIVDILCSSSDPNLKQLVAIMKNIDSYYVKSQKDNYDTFQPIKMRGIDPLVMQDGTLHRLSDIKADFKSELKLTKEYAKNGIFIKFVNINNTEILDMLKKANV